MYEVALLVCFALTSTKQLTTTRPKGMQNNNIFRQSKIFHAPLEVIQNTPNCGGPLNTSGKIIITWSEVSSNPLPDPVVNY